MPLIRCTKALLRLREGLSLFGRAPSRGRKSVSIWPSEFEEAIQHKSLITELQLTDEYNKKKLGAVKAAPSDATCSLFTDLETQHFFRLMMQDGEKERATIQFNNLFAQIKQAQLSKYYSASDKQRANIVVDPVIILKRAIENTTPVLNLREIEVAGTVYSVPVPISQSRARFRAVKWILDVVRTRDKSKTRFSPYLASLLIETANNTGPAVQKKNEHHRICEQNRAYIHLIRSK